MTGRRVKCLVTGGAGFVGSHLVDELLSRGCQVRVLDNLATGKKENLAAHSENTSFEFIGGSILNSDDVARCVEGVEMVFHLACLGVRHSLVYPRENHLVNTEGTLNVLQAAHRAGVKKVIYCSSSEVYGTAVTVPMDESHRTFPATVYGASKLAGEAYTRAYYSSFGLPTVVLRPFNIFGPRSHHEGQAGEMIPKSIVRALAGSDILIFGDGTITRDFTYVADTVRAIILASQCEDCAGRTLNIGSGREISLLDLSELLIAVIDRPGIKVSHLPPRPGDVLRLYSDSSAFRELTGWSPLIDFREGLQKTVEFFRCHPAGIENLAREEEGINWLSKNP